jgi:hypothetical protein
MMIALANTYTLKSTFFTRIPSKYSLFLRCAFCCAVFFNACISAYLIGLIIVTVIENPRVGGSIPPPATTEQKSHPRVAFAFSVD